MDVEERQTLLLSNSILLSDPLTYVEFFFFDFPPKTIRDFCQYSDEYTEILK